MTWTNETKDPNVEKPFHRINSPWFKKPGDQGKLVRLSSGQSGLVVGADGKGYECGCRSIDDFPDQGPLGNLKLALLRFIGAVSGLGDPREVMHTLPGWVPVLNRNPMAPRPPDDVNNPTQVECEGRLVRSFQTWTDAPGAQWHHWYDWNFLAVPGADTDEDVGYAYLRGAANKPPLVEDAGFTALLADPVMEFEWDCGAISASKPGPMFEGFLIKPDGSIDKDDERWFWPMRTHYIWAAGRWIYDCGHSNPPDDKDQGLMRTELHPMKAVASARWEAVKFDENEHFVPAIQFMFFMHKRTGYKEWKAINDVDYEFIVDLPMLDIPQELDWQIGHTAEFPFNTGALRTPHLLKKVRFMQMANLQTPGKVMPTIEPIKVDGDPSDAPPRQVRVKIPAKALPASADYYGFVLSMGWHDPSNVQARKVKKVTVSLDKFTIGNDRHDTVLFTGPTAEWQLRIGVNGRWMQTILYEGVKEKQTKDIEVDVGKQFIELHLADTDSLIINAHGQEFDRVGDFMAENNVEQRTLKKNGVPADWETDIVVKDGNADVLKATIDAVGSLMVSTLGIQNDPLGIIDPGTGPEDEKQHNPLTMKFVNDAMGGKMEDVPITLTAFFTKEVGKLAELAEKRGTMDYTLQLTVNVAPQKVD